MQNKTGKANNAQLLRSEGLSESGIVPPSLVQQRSPRTEQPLQECDVVQHRDTLLREGHRESIQE